MSIDAPSPEVDDHGDAASASPAGRSIAPRPAAAPASIRCTSMRIRIRAAARRRSSSASPRTASRAATSARSTAIRYTNSGY